MAKNNAELARIFWEMADIFELKQVRWKPQAYRIAAQTLESLKKDVSEIYKNKGEKGLEDLPGIGEGIAKIFYGGEYLIAKWVKESKDHNTLFYDSYGKMIKLNKGQTWIEVVPKETQVWIK